MKFVRDYVARNEKMNLLEQLWDWKYDDDTDMLKNVGISQEGVIFLGLIGIGLLAFICHIF